MNEGERQLFWQNDSKFRFLKWQFDAVQSDEYIQISELRFIDQDANIFQWPFEDLYCIDHSTHIGISITGQWYGKGQHNECAESLLDCKVDTKFCCNHHHQVPFFIAFDLGSQCLDLKTFNRYQWYTANDDTSFANRSPTSWQLFISNDSIKWDLLDKVENFTAPIANFTLAYTSQRLAT